MPSNYPASLDVFSNPGSGDRLNSPSHSEQHANVNDAVEAIEAELGTDPAGSATTVKRRLEDLETVVGSATGDIAELENVVQTWHEVVTGMHSWDAADAVLYAASGQYGDVGLRVDHIPDRGSDTSALRPLKRDDGGWASVWSTGAPGPVPGPLYIQSSSYFGGRPAVVCDEFDFVWSGGLGGGHNSVAGLATNVPATSTATHFHPSTSGHVQPYFIAALGRLVQKANLDDGGLLIDSIDGGITLSEDDNTTGKWGVTTDFGDPWPATTHNIDFNETVLILCQVSGTGSWIEFVSRDASGTVVRDRQSISLDSQTPPDYQNRSIHLGMTWPSAISALKMIDGTPASGTIDKLVDWASPYLPSNGRTIASSQVVATEVPVASTGLVHISSTTLQAIIEELDSELASISTAIDGRVAVTGDTMTGNLTLNNASHVIASGGTSQFSIGYTNVFGLRLFSFSDVVNSSRVLGYFTGGTTGSGRFTVNDNLTVVPGSTGQSNPTFGVSNVGGESWLFQVKPSGVLELTRLTPDPTAPPATGLNVYCKLDANSAAQLTVLRNGGTSDQVLTHQNYRRLVTESTTSRTFALTDSWSYVRFTNSSASSGTVPPNGSVAYPVGTEIEVRAHGAGGLTIVPGSGVTVNASTGGLTLSQGRNCTLRKIATNEWDQIG